MNLRNLLINIIARHFTYILLLTLLIISCPRPELQVITTPDYLHEARRLAAEHPLAETDRDGISVPRIIGLTSSDWGWWRTATDNLGKIGLYYDVEVGPEDLDLGRPRRFRPGAQVDALRAAIDAAPKSTRWKLRSRIGDRMPWYEEPEEVGHGRD